MHHRDKSFALDHNNTSKKWRLEFYIKRNDTKHTLFIVIKNLQLDHLENRTLPKGRATFYFPGTQSANIINIASVLS